MTEQDTGNFSDELPESLQNREQQPTKEPTSPGGNPVKDTENQENPMNEEENRDIESDIETEEQPGETHEPDDTDKQDMESPGSDAGENSALLPEADSAETNSSLSVARNLFDYVELFVVSICVVMLFFTFVMRLCRVDGPSMEDTLYEDQKLVISNIGYTPSRGDIIVFHQTGYLNEPIVKRVIATSGEWILIQYVEIGSNTAYVTQKMVVRVYDKDQNLIEELQEDYIKLDTTFPMLYPYFGEKMVQVPEGYVFVMGDNRNHSTDSRSLLIGFVDERRILGHVIFRLTPFSKFGRVD